MSSLLLIATAAVVPFMVPFMSALPASMSSSLGPAYLVLFGAALFKAGRTMRRPSETVVAAPAKDAWPTTVPQSSVHTI